MAQLDGSFYLQSQGPDVLGGFERGMRLGEMVRQRKAQELEQQKQNDIKDAYNSGYETRPDGSSFFNPQRVSEYLKSKGLGLEAQKFSSDYQAQQAAQLKSQLDNQYNQSAVVSSLLGTVRDQQTYDAAKAQAMKLGIPGVDQLPPQYSPQIIDGLKAQYGKGSMSYKDQLDDSRKREEAQARLAELQDKRIERKEAAANKLTVGQEAADREIGKDYANMSANNASFEKNLQRLNDAEALIKKRQEDFSLIPTSGKIIGRIPDFLTPEENTFIRQEVQGAAQSSLKAALGSQFTEKEGERIMAAAYDEKLSPEANLKKIALAKKELLSSKAQKDAMLKEFEKSGSISKFKSGQSQQALDPQDQEAWTWAQQNKSDPRAPQIIEKIKGKYGL